MGRVLDNIFPAEAWIYGFSYLPTTEIAMSREFTPARAQKTRLSSGTRVGRTPTYG